MRSATEKRCIAFGFLTIVLLLVVLPKEAMASNAEQAYAACEALRQQIPTDPQKWGINYCNYYSQLRYLDTPPPAYFLENSYWGTRKGSFRISDTSCPNALQTFDPSIGRCVLAGDAGKNAGDPPCGAEGADVNNPCNAATGNKRHVETLFIGGDGVPSLTLHYNSLATINKRFGFGWTTALHRRLVINGSAVQAGREDGKSFPFTCDTTACLSSADINIRLIPDTSGYSLLLRNGLSERYDTRGVLVSETDSAGRVTSYTYQNNFDGTPYVKTVRGPFGHVVTFNYHMRNLSQVGMVSQFVDAAGNPINFGYGPPDALSSIVYTDNSGSQFHYESTDFPDYLTGISYRESNGVATRYSTYAYSNGKAVLTEHAGGMERATLQYDSDTQTTVRDAIDTVDIMSFATTLGVKQLIARTKPADGKSFNQVFDASNNVTCQKDEEGRVTTFSYNSSNQKTSETQGLVGDCANPITTSATRTTTYQYASNVLDVPTIIERPSVRAGNVKRESFTYGDSRFPTLPTVITQSGYTSMGTPVNRTVTLAYNANGQVTSVDGPRTDVSDVTTLSYYNCTTGGACGQLQSVTNALGHTTTYDTYDGNGRVTQVTDANSVRTNYVYDARGRVGALIVTPVSGAARTTTYTYNAANNVTSVTFPDGIVLTHLYDAAQKLASVTDNLGNKVQYGYDLKGNRTDEGTYDPNGTLVRAIQTAYDIRNNVASVNNGGSITTLVADAIGNLTRETDAIQTAASSGIHTQHQHDALNRLFETVNNVGGLTSYGYDVNDRLTQVKTPNNATTSYQYDDLGNLLQEVSPDRDTVTYGYDAAGNIKTVTDARGVTVSYAYDAVNRLTLIDYPSDTDTTLTYDASPSGLACANGVGRLCQVADESGTTQYAFDAFGNTVEQRKTELTRTYTTRYTYDAGNRILTITYPDNRLVTYTRDTVGRITAVTATVGGIAKTIASNRAYAPDGLLLSQTHGNGLNEVREYTLKGELTYQTVGTDTRVYTYDLNGNPTQVQTIPQVGNYLYDALDRMTRDQIVTGSTSNQVYLYDGNGNRTKKASTVYSYTPNTNRLIQTGSTAITYDSAGNMLTNGTARYTYNDHGRLKTASSGTTLRGTYTYNHLGQRTRKVAGTTTTVYHYDIFGNLILETSNTAVTRVAYTYVNNEPIAQVRRSGSTDTLVHIHTDHEGTPRSATNVSGVKVWYWEGRAFGDTNPNQNPSGTGTTTINLRYPGQYYDSETTLHYNHHRYYSRVLGRYITSDPIGLRAGPNTYVYVDSNPLRFIDPNGLAQCSDEPEWTDEPIEPLYPECLIPALRYLCTATNNDGLLGIRKKPGSLGKPKGTDALRRENSQVDGAAKDAGLSRREKDALHKEVQQESQHAGRPLSYNEIRELVRDLFGK